MSCPRSKGGSLNAPPGTSSDLGESRSSQLLGLLVLRFPKLPMDLDTTNNYSEVVGSLKGSNSRNAIECFQS